MVPAVAPVTVLERGHGVYFPSTDQAGSMAFGTIKSVRSNGGYGFISRPGGRDIFFHIRESDFAGLDFDEKLIELDVTFDETEDRRSGKLCAVNVRPAR